MPDQHALLAPSAAKRWMTCHPSALLEAQEPEKDTVYTKEGTIAHAVGELFLTFYRDRHFLPATDVLKEIEAWRPNAGPGVKLFALQKEAEDLGLDFNEILTTVHDNYAVPVIMDYYETQKADPEARLFIEERLNLKAFIPEGFGSSDAIILGNRQLKVYDLKYGKGVKVSAHDNPQMSCYALGALVGPGELAPVDTVHMVIVQPRLQHVSSVSIAAPALLQWGFSVLRPEAEKAFRGEGDLVPGEHCRFCAVAPRCRALAARAQSLSVKAGDPQLLSNEELSEVLGDVDQILSWCEKVKAYALEKMLDGESFPGFKVVEGKSVRQITDLAGAMKALQEAGFEESSYIRPKELKTLGDLGKLLGKKGLDLVLGEFITKPAGKPTLAPDTDPRPAYNSATTDFDNINP